MVASTEAMVDWGAHKLAELAVANGVTVSATATFATHANTTHFEGAIRTVLKSGNRAILLVCRGSDASRFIRAALDSGAAGEGYAYLSADMGIASTLFWQGDEVLQERALRGSFTMHASNGLGTSNHLSYFARRQQLPPVYGADDGSCSTETDDDGTPLWAQDHDDDPSTPLACTKHDLRRESPYDAFGYDAAYAIAYALHDLLELQNRTEIVGTELFDTLIKR
eukprot:4203554-Prymnesium_polylepis.1